jgi:hypothetical protein
MPRLKYHNLPGVSNADPDFYDGARFADRGRSAAPVSTGTEPDLGAGRPNLAWPAPNNDAPTNDDYTQRPDPSPFKLGE